MTRYMRGLDGDRLRRWALTKTLSSMPRSACSSENRSAQFQLMQDLLAKMLANITASQCMVVRMAPDWRTKAKLTDAHAALSKAFCTAKCRETVAWARELFGGNGIVADYNVARFFADAEALYSYEGTYQMQNSDCRQGHHRLQRVRVSA